MSSFRRLRAFIACFRSASTDDATPAAASTSLATPPVDGEPILSLIASQERLVDRLSAEADVLHTLLLELYRAAGLPPPTADPVSPLSPVADPAVVLGVRAVDIEARLLGAFELRYRGQLLDPWAAQRAASLLKLLLLNDGRPVRREELMEAFWPQSTAKSARNNLNAAVYQLRSQLRVLDPNRTHIVYAAGCYGLGPGITWRTDVNDYATVVAAGRGAVEDGDEETAIRSFQLARSLYRGPLLEGDTSGDWYIESQRRFDVEHCALLEHLGGLLLEHDRPGEVIAVGDELIDADPCRETGHQLLMRAYAALDQPQLVVEQFHRCRATMRRELSIGPTSATVELFRLLVPDLS